MFGESAALSAELRVDRVCDLFEAALSAGKDKRVEEYLYLVSSEDRSLGIVELLRVELEYSKHQEPMPELAEYVERFPEQGELIEAVYHDVLTRETRHSTVKHEDSNSAEETANWNWRGGPRIVRCPVCDFSAEIGSDSTLTDWKCPSCDNSLSDNEPTEQRSQLTIGRFKLIEKVGEGGFGAVWRAWDPKLDRTVALKVPRRERRDPDEIEKFKREARAAAQLNHPSIASTYELGEDEDTIFIISDFVSGETLASRLRRDSLSIEAAVQICSTVADALHHAHEQGVVHRDLKPSNIIMTDDNQPVITDFGLAKRQSGEDAMTVQGTTLGTPAYMSPEQARGDAHLADRRSDVYSLGVILFELLTGERPFRGDVTMLLYQVLTDDPPRPSRLNSRVNPDLETICLKSLEKDPRQRYLTALALKDDLERYLHGEPILARPSTKWDRTIKWVKRKPAIASLSAAVFVVAAVGIAGVVNQSIRANRNAAEANANASEANINAAQAAANAKTAERNAAEARRNLAASAFQAARLAGERGQWRIAISELDKAEAAGYDDPIQLELERIRALRSVSDFREWSQRIEALSARKDLGKHEGQVHILAADRQRLRGNQKAAEGLILRALELQLPRDEEHYARALIAETTPEVIDHLVQAVEIDRFDHSAISSLVAAYVLSGRRDEARELATFATSIFPEDPGYPSWLALLAATENDKNEMDKWITAIGDQTNAAYADWVRSMLTVAEDLSRLVNNIDEPISMLQLPFTLFQAWSKISRMQRQVGAGEQSFSSPHYESVTMSLLPAFKRAYAPVIELFPAAIANLFVGFDKNIQALEEAAKMHPEGSLHFLRAALLLRSQRHAEAETALAHAAETPAILPGVRHQSNFLAAAAAYVRFSKSDFKNKVDGQRAMEYGRKRIADPFPLKPAHSDLLANIFVDAGDFNSARTVIEMAKRDYKDRLEWLRIEAVVEQLAGNYFKSIQAADEALQRKPEDPESLRTRARSLQKIRDYADALGDADAKE